MHNLTLCFLTDIVFLLAVFFSMIQNSSGSWIDLIRTAKQRETISVNNSNRKKHAKNMLVPQVVTVVKT